MGSSISCVELGSGKIDREARRQVSDQAEWCYGGNSFELNFKFNTQIRLQRIHKNTTSTTCADMNENKK